MLFNSFQFLIFFPVVTFLYFLLPHKSRWFLLLTASCVFYMSFIPKYILILGFTIVIDYFAGLMLEKSTGKKKHFYLTLSLIANIGILCVFKYYNFFITNVNYGLIKTHLGEISFPLLHFVLPLGLSFHTFQAMSYTIEVYRGNQKAEKHFGIYALYVMFYPQLVAGPIERPQNMLHQFREKHEFNYNNAVSGLRLMLWGMFKKVVIADNLALLVNNVYNAPKNFSGLPLLVAAIFFILQLYCDFSAYSDIALGAARVMGFSLMRNFKNPYISKNMPEFWRRWHISLSSWLNDYLFTPLSIKFRNMNMAGILLAINITFFISGLWHGAGWNFIIWGILNGFAISYHILSKKIRGKMMSLVPKNVYNSLSVFLVLVFWMFMGIFFRLKTMGDIKYVIGHLFAANYSIISGSSNYGFSSLSQLFSSWLPTTVLFGSLIILFIVEIRPRKTTPTEYINRLPTWSRWSIYYALIFLILAYGEMNNTQFIYFQF